MVIILTLNLYVETQICHRFLRMKRVSHQSSSTTTTCGTKTCKCPFSWSDNSVVVMKICCSHTKPMMRVVPLLLCNVLHSVSSWWQQIQICLGLYVAHCNSCPLLGISIHCVEYSMNTQSDSMAPQPQRPALSAVTQCELDYEMLTPRTLCFQVKLIRADCW